MIVGGDRGHLGISHRNLRVVGRQLQVLLVLSRAVVAMCQGEDQRVAALKLAERAHRAGVVRKSVIREDAARCDVRSHTTHGRTRGRPVAPLKHTGRTLAGRSRGLLVAATRWWRAAVRWPRTRA